MLTCLSFPYIKNFKTRKCISDLKKNVLFLGHVTCLKTRWWKFCVHGFGETTGRICLKFSTYVSWWGMHRWKAAFSIWLILAHFINVFRIPIIMNTKWCAMHRWAPSLRGKDFWRVKEWRIVCFGHSWGREREGYVFINLSRRIKEGRINFQK